LNKDLCGSFKLVSSKTSIVVAGQPGCWKTNTGCWPAGVLKQKTSTGCWPAFELKQKTNTGCWPTGVLTQLIGLELDAFVDLCGSSKTRWKPLGSVALTVWGENKAQHWLLLASWFAERPTEMLANRSVETDLVHYDSRLLRSLRFLQDLFQLLGSVASPILGQKQSPAI
jgi:hypothetical protein